MAAPGRAPRSAGRGIPPPSELPLSAANYPIAAGGSHRRCVFITGRQIPKHPPLGLQGIPGGLKCYRKIIRAHDIETTRIDRKSVASGLQECLFPRPAQIKGFELHRRRQACQYCLFGWREKAADRLWHGLVAMDLFHIHPHCSATSYREQAEIVRARYVKLQGEALVCATKIRLGRCSVAEDDVLRLGVQVRSEHMSQGSPCSDEAFSVLLKTIALRPPALIICENRHASWT